MHGARLLGTHFILTSCRSSSIAAAFADFLRIELLAQSRRDSGLKVYFILETFSIGAAVCRVASASSTPNSAYYRGDGQRYELHFRLENTFSRALC
jgi:hypothetical protein